MVDNQNVEVESVDVYTHEGSPNYTDIPLSDFNLKGGMIYLFNVSEAEEAGDEVESVMLPETSVKHIKENGVVVEPEDDEEDTEDEADEEEEETEAESEPPVETASDEEREEAVEAGGEHLTDKTVSELEDLVPNISRVDVLEAALEADDRVTAQELYEERIAELTDDE